MKTSILNTEFNFAKSINLSLIAAPKAYPSYPQGIREFITPYLEELQNKTIIPDYLTLVSIQTIDNQDAGVHILTFTINNPETFDDDDTAEIEPDFTFNIEYITFQVYFD
jgi:hypothetical protein